MRVLHLWGLSVCARVVDLAFVEVSVQREQEYEPVGSPREGDDGVDGAAQRNDRWGHGMGEGREREPKILKIL